MIANTPSNRRKFLGLALAATGLGADVGTPSAHAPQLELASMWKSTPSSRVDARISPHRGQFNYPAGVLVA